MLLKAEGSKNLLQVFLSTIITVILAYFKTCALLRSLRVQCEYVIAGVVTLSIKFEYSCSVYGHTMAPIERER